MWVDEFDQSMRHSKRALRSGNSAPRCRSTVHESPITSRFFISPLRCNRGAILPLSYEDAIKGPGAEKIGGARALDLPERRICRKRGHGFSLSARANFRHAKERDPREPTACVSEQVLLAPAACDGG